MRENVSQALFLHFTGIKWAVLFKKLFSEFFDSPAWERQTEMTKSDRDRRSYFLGETSKTFGIEHERRSKFKNPYFLSQLPDEEEEGDDSMKRIEQAEEEDEAAYRRAKEKWEQTAITGRDWQIVAHLPNDVPRDFKPWDEYIRFRWERSLAFREAWGFLFKRVSEQDVEITLPVKGLIGKLPGKGLEVIRKNTAEMTPYWKGIVALYAEKMRAKFGALAVVKKGLLPMGMVALRKGGKVRWQG
ncbi:MAG: hypothetical protein Q9187_004775 [Circinaria calcarea]